MPDRVQTQFGDIFRPTGACKDDYGNIKVYDQGGGKTVFGLQLGAMNSFKAAEQRLNKLMHPVRYKKTREFIKVLPGTNRSCSLQRQLWLDDPDRFAHPDVTLHTRSLAIDVDQSQGRRKLALIHKVLMGHGWKQSRPDDEPWHYSYHFVA